VLFVHEAHPDADETLLFLQGGNVAGWTWYDLAASLSDHHSLIPDLPGFGGSNAEPWTTVAEVADSVAAIIRERAHGGRAHVIGLSLGAVVGTVLVARHPDLVRSAMLSGAPLQGVGTTTRLSGLAQVRLWVRGRRHTQTPILMLAGERESKAVQRALTEVTSRAPKAVARVVPRMHHAWSAEDPELFRHVLHHWLARHEPASELLGRTR
jgi:pimeloyl-ACP methyl ester carboxylesterase